jgi:hypothetical protein
MNIAELKYNTLDRVLTGVFFVIFLVIVIACLPILPFTLVNGHSRKDS